MKGVPQRFPRCGGGNVVLSGTLLCCVTGFEMFLLSLLHTGPGTYNISDITTEALRKAQ